MLSERVLGRLVPQLLNAFTDNTPPTVPAVTEIVFVVEVPVQPEGSVHVYPVAPLTAGTV